MQQIITISFPHAIPPGQWFVADEAQCMTGALVEFAGGICR
ncbi:hypothetical protein N8616_01415 [Verrucomicrobia bacterium]|nr:hypothetical protein [Verrucomicrobiota bacterium]